MDLVQVRVVFGGLYFVVLLLCCNAENLPTLPENFTMAFDVNNLLTKETTIMEEASSMQPLPITGLHIWKNEMSAGVIVRRFKKDYIYYDGKGSCVKKEIPTNWTNVNPLSLPECFPPTILTLYDLLQFLNQTKTWTSKKIITEDAQHMQKYEALIDMPSHGVVNVTAIFFSLWPMQSATNATKLLRYMHIVFNGTAGSAKPLVANLSYSFFYYKTYLDDATMEQFFLPPEGVHCDGPNDQPLPLIALDNFVVSIDVLRNREQLLSEIRLIYSYDERITSFTNMNTSALAFNQGLNVSGDALTISQDFDYGLQYVLDYVTGSCSAVQPIPLTSGLLKVVEIAEVNQTVYRLKNATEALLSADLLSYSYVGKRTVDDTLLDVWTAKQIENNTCVAVREVLFRKDMVMKDEMGRGMTVTLPWALRIYNNCNAAKMNQRTTYEFYNFLPLSPGFIPWKRFDVSPCLVYTRNDSYLMVLVNVTMDALSAAGTEVVENFMRHSLAKIAGVSPFRVSRFMFQPNGGSTMVFFQLSNMSSVVGTHTEYFKPEKDVLEARRSLNHTLLNDYSITVPGQHGKSLTFAIVAGTLADSYKLCHGGGGGSVIVTYTGYSGGSMAGLGISMLMLGSFFGIIVGFYLWKRNRGIAYQMYE